MKKFISFLYIIIICFNISKTSLKSMRIPWISIHTQIFNKNSTKSHLKANPQNQIFNTSIKSLNQFADRPLLNPNKPKVVPKHTTKTHTLN